MKIAYLILARCSAASFFVSTACSPVASPIPLPEHLSIRERIDHADLIVVGILGSEAIIGPSRHDQDLELRRVDVSVEGVIKGKVDGHRLSYLYYASLGSHTGHPHNLVYPGQRAIVYLRTEGTSLRATNDVYVSHTNLVTGRHNIHTVTDDEAAREQIVRLLLLPGKGADVSAYLSALDRITEAASGIVGDARTAEYLRRLLQFPDVRIQSRACILLSQPPLSDTRCLGR